MRDPIRESRDGQDQDVGDEDGLREAGQVGGGDVGARGEGEFVVEAVGEGAGSRRVDDVAVGYREGGEGAVLGFGQGAEAG